MIWPGYGKQQDKGSKNPRAMCDKCNKERKRTKICHHDDHCSLRSCRENAFQTLQTLFTKMRLSKPSQLRDCGQMHLSRRFQKLYNLL